MLSLWAIVQPNDVARYAATLVLPSYLSHLCLEPVSFADQSSSCDGHESLQLTYRGQGRLEHYRLSPEEHALGLLCQVCPGVDVARVHLPRDDAHWHWSAASDAPASMRIYFAPTAQTLPDKLNGRPAENAYVSVTRGYAFVGRSVVESYLADWLARLGIEAGPIRCDFQPPGGGVEFSGQGIGGQLLLDDETSATDLLRFAGLETALGDVGDFAVLDLEAGGGCLPGDNEEGVYLGLRSTEGM